MDKFILFLKIIAWVSAVVSTLFFFVCSYLTLTYEGSLDELKDKTKGKKTVYPSFWWFIVAIISWAFLIVY